MKAQNILLTLFVLLVPFMVFAQKQHRTLAPEEILDMRRGNLSSFDNYHFRFETAFEESDLQSMKDIQVELLKIMQDEIAQLEQRSELTPSKTLTSRIGLQKSLRKQFEEQSLPAGFGNARPAFLVQLSEFRGQMEAELKDLEAQLKANRND